MKEPGRPAMVTVTGMRDIGDAVAWLARERTALRAALDEHGAVYLRGLPVASTADFAQVRDQVLAEPARYQEKATPRSSFGNGVFSSTDLPPAQPIRQHNENSYTLNFPGLLMFGCLIAPSEGGATPVTDCRALLRELPPGLVERFRTRGWTLARSFDENISLDWQTAFATDATDEVERYCAEHEIAFEWRPDGGLRTAQRRAAVITHPRTGAEVWFNHVAFWSEWALDPDIRDVLIGEFGRDGLPFRTTYGDGTPITEDEIAALDAAYARTTVRETWQPGDVLIVDNILSAHGREAFAGDRRIVVAMGDPIALADCHPSVAPAPGLFAAGVGAAS